MCTGRDGERKKTRKMAKKLKSDSYVRAPRMNFMNRSQYRANIQIMSMFSMLNCAINFNKADRYKSRARDTTSHYTKKSKAGPMDRQIDGPTR